jgi:uncharacterized membrane protein
MSLLLRAGLLGLASGSRSTLGVVALVLTAKPAQSFLPRRSAAHTRWTRRIALLGSTGELVGDKLPQTPSRSQPRAAGLRLILGAISGAALAHREGSSRRRTMAGGVVGALGAAVGTRLGASWRGVATKKFGPDLPGAIVEDAVAMVAAKYATGGRGRILR